MACEQAGTSIAAIALEHGGNANRVHRWIREYPHGVVWADRDVRKYVIHSDESALCKAQHQAANAQSIIM